MHASAALFQLLALCSPGRVVSSRPRSKHALGRQSLRLLECRRQLAAASRGGARRVQHQLLH
eukprot:2493037-Lingulodinium_polyedra.AAC.1